MAKNTTKKIKELKGVKSEKITDEQLAKVQETINNINRSQLEIGSMETRKPDLLHGMAVSRDELKILQAEFEKEYGTTDINVQDGTINYPQENGEADKKD